MSKLQRHGHLMGRCFATTPCPQEDEMYEVGYTKSIPRLCRICKHHHGQIYGGVELVCAFHPSGYSEDSYPDRQVKRRLNTDHI